MKNVQKVFTLLLMFPLLASCGGGGTPEVPATAEPEIRIFKISPSVADPMERTILTWDTNAESAEISGFGAVPPSGSREITADTSKVFTIIARVRDIVRTAQANLTVRPRVDPPPGPSPKPACSDGLDNDGDGKVDLSDPGCTDPLDTDETDPVIPPLQDACVENPGVMVAGGDNFFYNNGMEGLRVFGENKTYFIKNKSNPDDTYSWLEFCEQGAGESGFSCIVLAEYAHGATGGGIHHTYDVGSDGSIYLVWWRVGATIAPFDTRAYFVSRLSGSISWSNPAELPYPFTIPYSLPKLKVFGDTVYLLDQPDFGRTSITMIRRVGGVWQPAREIYQNLNASVQLTSAQVDASGKVYVFFSESPIWPATDTYMSLATSVDQGAIWSVARVPVTLENIGGGEIVASNGTIYRLAGRPVTKLQSMTSPSTNWESSNWTNVADIPPDIIAPFDSGFLHPRNGGFTILGLGKRCTSTAGRTIRPAMRADFMSGVWTMKTVQTLDTNGGDAPTFSGAVTPEGGVYTLLARNVATGACSPLCPTELWLGKDP